MSQLIQKIRDIGLAQGWKYPFFLPALSRVSFQESEKVPTMGITKGGLIYLNVAFCSRLGDEQLAAVLFHELMHLMCDHAHRQEHRTAMAVTEQGQPIPLWNVAADMAINEVLREMGLHLPQGAVYPKPAHRGLNAEQIYDALLEELSQNPESRFGTSGKDGTPSPGGGCAPQPGDQPAEGESEGDSPAGTAGNVSPEEWEKVAVQARAMAAGTESGGAFARLFERRQAIRWEDFCRSAISRAVSQHGRDEQSFTRRNRRSPGRVILPGWRATRAQACAVIDASGSVSDEMLSVAIDQIQRIAELAMARIYVVVHDAGVQTAGWANGLNRADLEGRIRGRGGTTFTEAYQAVAEVPAAFDFMVHLTDGEVYGDWPGRPANCRRLVVALLGDSKRPENAPAEAEILNVDVV